MRINQQQQNETDEKPPPKKRPSTPTKRWKNRKISASSIAIYKFLYQIIRFEYIKKILCVVLHWSDLQQSERIFYAHPQIIHSVLFLLILHTHTHTLTHRTNKFTWYWIGFWRIRRRIKSYNVHSVFTRAQITENKNEEKQILNTKNNKYNKYKHADSRQRFPFWLSCKNLIRVYSTGCYPPTDSFLSANFLAFRSTHLMSHKQICYSI